MSSDSDNRDYQEKYLDERFERIYSQLDQSNKLNIQQHNEIKERLSELQTKLADVHKEQKKTNGRVNHLELQTTLARKIQQRPFVMFSLLLILTAIIDLFTNAELKQWLIQIFS